MKIALTIVELVFALLVTALGGAALTTGANELLTGELHPSPGLCMTLLFCAAAAFFGWRGIMRTADSIDAFLAER